ncbi:MAG TPA: hypothetical protein VFO86_04340, partial [Terriglobia bacterium]|nr:hypothetical protein [Terriglobia bacterium]
MKQFQTNFTRTRKITVLKTGRSKNRWSGIPKVAIAWMFVFISTAHAQSPRNPGFQMPSAPSYVSNDDVYQVGTLKLKAKGLLPNKTFRVFLAADFLGEIATNVDGRGSIRARTLVEGDWLRMNLRSAVLRFNNPSFDDVCFKPDHSEIERISPDRRNGPDRRFPSATTTFITS